LENQFSNPVFLAPHLTPCDYRYMDRRTALDRCQYDMAERQFRPCAAVCRPHPAPRIPVIALCRVCGTIFTNPEGVCPFCYSGALEVL
jgi:rubrerythrin